MERQDERKLEKYARGDEAEMQGYFAEYGEMKQVMNENQRDADNNRIIFNERTAEDFEKERQLNQVLSFLPHEQKVAQIQKVLDHSDSKSVKVGNFTMDNGALMYILAENFQRTEAGISPQAEYYVWRDVTDRLIVELNTDGASVKEVGARNSFIDFLENREAEMKMVMSLYYAAAFNGNGYYQEAAKAQYQFMRFKLSELRRFKAKMHASPSLANAEELQKQKEENQKRLYEREVNTVELAARSIGGRAVQLGAAEVLRRHARDVLLGDEMEHDVAGHFTRINPPTRNKEEARARIVKLSERQIIQYQRMGLSREEAEEKLRKEKLKLQHSNISPKSRFLSVYRKLEMQNVG